MTHLVNPCHYGIRTPCFMELIATVTKNGPESPFNQYNDLIQQPCFIAATLSN